MSLFAGIFSLSPSRRLPEAACDSLRRVVSRDPRDEPSVYRDERCCFVKVDVGAFGEPAWRVDENGAVSMLAGEPLLDAGDGAGRPSRARDLDALHESWLKNDWSAPRRARGMFCAAHYSPETGELSLVADKLCLRPLYYWVGDGYVVFATALRVLESLDVVRKEMDLRAVTEMVSLNISLGTRTPYVNVSLLHAGEVAHFSERGTTFERYWSWEEIEPSTRPEEELAREAYERFTAAVARRLDRDETTFAFLSGGLDSRSVVSALWQRGLRVHTFNFSPKGSQDQIFGAEFARALGTVHTESPRKDEGGPDWMQMLADAWDASRARREWPAERPALAWSGDGGSVGLGHVYVTQEIVDLMRAGRADEAVESYLRREGANVPESFFKKFLREEVAAELSGAVARGMREELDKIRCADPGRAFHLFLMLNDQRRHLSRHLENIDRHRLELLLPFYDSDFLSLVLSVPVEPCLAHKFYMKFLACFRPVVTSVPWQTYPGHEPCPLPAPRELSYQWGDGARPAAEKKRSALERAERLLVAPDFPAELFKKGRLRLATLVHRTGARDYAYVFEAAQTYYKCWTLCGGRFSLPPTQAAG